MTFLIQNPLLNFKSFTVPVILQEKHKAIQWSHLKLTEGIPVWWLDWKIINTWMNKWVKNQKKRKERGNKKSLKNSFKSINKNLNRFHIQDLNLSCSNIEPFLPILTQGNNKISEHLFCTSDNLNNLNRISKVEN